MFAGSVRNKRVGNPEDDELDITPMIDVTFLLLIFFMVTSSMESTSLLDVPPARHGLGVSQEKATVISIFKTDHEPEIYLSNGTKQNGPVEPAAVTAYVQQGMAEGKMDVIIKADRDVASGIVDEISRAADEANTVDGQLKFYLGVIDRPQ